MLVDPHDRGVDRGDPIKIAQEFSAGLDVFENFRPRAILGSAVEVL
jgi:hypothetical protein